MTVPSPEPRQTEPGLADKVIGTLWDVGGDPGQIDGAANTFRGLATQLRGHSDFLSSVAKAVLDTWSSGASRDAFKTRTDKLQQGYAQYTGSLDDVAGQLNKVADLIRDAQRQARNLKIMAAAAIAVGIGFSLLSFGISAAAGAAEAAGCAAGFWALMARLAASILEVVATVLRALSFSKKAMAIGFGISAASNIGFKALGQNKLAPWTWEADKFTNPLNPDLWSANDASNILLGSILAGGLNQASNGLKGAKGLTGMTGGNAAFTRLGGNFLAGLAGGGAGSGVVQLWLLDKSLDDAKGTIAITALLSGGATSASRFIPYNSLTSAIQPSPGVLSSGDWVRQLTGIPVGAELYNLNFGKSQPPNLTGPVTVPPPPNPGH